MAKNTSTMSDASGSSEDDADYAFGDSHMAESKRFPIHDCCEFEDAETLRVSEAFRNNFARVRPHFVRHCRNVAQTVRRTDYL